ncbi:MAG: carbon-nitrogen hydrolase family protein [Thermomicrobiales bacterium]|nr:carbon-nitrogen hydrolase family protein [Thermomicrobiales bacterium]
MIHVGALQLGTSSEGTAATLAKIFSYEEQIAAHDLVVMPEALLGGYPKGEGFGTLLGYRLQEGRETFAAYAAQAITIPGPEIAALADLSRRTDTVLVVGVIERAGSTLYCTQVYFDPEHGFIGKHRKLMPTATERLIWGQGDGSTLMVAETAIGKIGGAICWEHYMPLLRTALYAKGLEIWAASTVDTRDIWQSTMRHIATEGRCFVVSACQYLPTARDLGLETPPGWDAETPLIDGGSVICDPYGNVLAGPLRGTEGMVSAEVDLAVISQARYDLDVVGHYARPDVFQLTVDTREKQAVSFSKSSEEVSDG